MYVFRVMQQEKVAEWKTNSHKIDYKPLNSYHRAVFYQRTLDKFN